MSEMAKFNNFAAAAESLKKSSDFDKALKERESQVQAQMDAMWEARDRKAACDRKAQMSRDWYLR